VLPCKAQNRKHTFPDLLLPQETSNLTSFDHPNHPHQTRADPCLAQKTNREGVEISQKEKRIERGGERRSKMEDTNKMKSKEDPLYDKPGDDPCSQVCSLSLH
jgi:hypothetical protein